MKGLFLLTLLLAQSPEAEFARYTPLKIEFTSVDQIGNTRMTTRSQVLKVGNTWRLTTETEDGYKEILIVEKDKGTLYMSTEEKPVEIEFENPFGILTVFGLDKNPNDVVEYNSTGLPVKIKRPNGETIIVKEYRQVEGFGYIPTELVTYFNGKPVSKTVVNRVDFPESLSESSIRLPAETELGRSSQKLKEKIGSVR